MVDRLWLYWFCGAVALVGALATVLVFGLSVLTVAVGLLLLLCPLLVIWLALRLDRRTEQDIAAAVRDEIGRRGR